MTPADADAEDPADRLEHAGAEAAAPAVRWHSRPATMGCTPISSIPTILPPRTRMTSSPRPPMAAPVTAFVATRQQGRRAVPSGKEPDARPRPHLEFPALEALTMILFPAIDLKDGQCVRLKLGDMEQATVYNPDPAAQAKAFEDQGFEWLHVVDLNGAFAGETRQRRCRRCDPEGDEKPGAARRRHPHARPYRKLAVARPCPRHPRHGCRARSGAGDRSLPADSRAGSPSASTPRAARSPSRAGRKPPNSASSNWRRNSRAPALRRSSTPTSTATAS